MKVILRAILKLTIFLLMLFSMALGGWLGTKAGVKFLAEFKVPTRPKALMEKVDEERYEHEGLGKFMKAFKALERNNYWDLPPVILPSDLQAYQGDEKLLSQVIKGREGPLFKMKPPKEVKKKEEKKEEEEKKKELQKREQKKEEVKKKAEVEKPSQLAERKPSQEERKRKAPTLYYLQVGIFSMRDNAEFVRDELNSIGVRNVQVILEQKRGLSLYKVLVGPFRSRGEAERVAGELRGRGYSSFIIKR